MLDLQRDPDGFPSDLTIHELTEQKAKRMDKLLNPEVNLSRQEYQELLIKAECGGPMFSFNT